MVNKAEGRFGTKFPGEINRKISGIDKRIFWRE